MEKRILTVEERARLEALIKTTRQAAGLAEMELERLNNELKAHRTFLRDFDEPLLFPGAADNPDLQTIIDSCHSSDNQLLDCLMKIKIVKCCGIGFPVKDEKIG